MADAQAPKQSNRWKWVSVILAVAVIGLLIWAVTAQSDKNDLQDQVDQGQQAGSEVVAGGKALYDDVNQQLGTANEDLAETEQDLADSQKQADDAKKEADDAQKEADQAKDETEKAKAEADKAKAEQKETESKVAVLADCAKAYIGAFGKVLDGEDSSKVQDELKKITEDCKAAFSGA
jgi:peptidoglycan hydrolase CwlO-like protein